MHLLRILGLVILFEIFAGESSDCPLAKRKPHRQSCKEKPDPDVSKDDLELAKNGHDVIKIIERYGDPQEKLDHQCLWSRTRLHLHAAKSWRYKKARQKHPNTGTNAASKQDARGTACKKHRTRCKTSVPSPCMQKQLQEIRREDQNMLRYLQSRFYMLFQARQNLQHMQSHLKQLMDEQTHRAQMGARFVRQNSKILGQVDALMQRRLQVRNQEQKDAIAGRMAQFLHDVDGVLSQMQRREFSMKRTMKTWIQLNQKEKRHLFRAIRAAQKRDMEKVLQLQALRKWYNRRVHLMDLESRKRLEGIIKWMHKREEAYHDRLAEEVLQLRKSNDVWHQREAKYKENLLAMSQKQDYLLALNFQQGQEINCLNNMMMRGVLPSQRDIYGLGRKNLREINLLKNKPMCNCTPCPAPLSPVFVPQPIPMLVHVTNDHSPSQLQTTPRRDQDQGHPEARSHQRMKRPFTTNRQDANKHMDSMGPAPVISRHAILDHQPPERLPHSVLRNNFELSTTSEQDSVPPAPVPPKHWASQQRDSTRAPHPLELGEFEDSKDDMIRPAPLPPRQALQSQSLDQNTVPVPPMNLAQRDRSEMNMVRSAPWPPGHAVKLRDMGRSVHQFGLEQDERPEMENMESAPLPPKQMLSNRQQVLNRAFPNHQHAPKQMLPNHQHALNQVFPNHQHASKQRFLNYQNFQPLDYPRLEEASEQNQYRPSLYHMRNTSPPVRHGMSQMDAQVNNDETSLHGSIILDRTAPHSIVDKPYPVDSNHEQHQSTGHSWNQLVPHNANQRLDNKPDSSDERWRGKYDTYSNYVKDKSEMTNRPPINALPLTPRHPQMRSFTNDHQYQLDSFNNELPETNRDQFSTSRDQNLHANRERLLSLIRKSQRLAFQNPTNPINSAQRFQDRNQPAPSPSNRPRNPPPIPLPLHILEEQSQERLQNEINQLMQCHPSKDRHPCLACHKQDQRNFNPYQGYPKSSADNESSHQSQSQRAHELNFVKHGAEILKSMADCCSGVTRKCSSPRA